ncbi:hypothetical protein PROFUN_11992, partial [Planoprotostelium fungivorum]
NEVFTEGNGVLNVIRDQLGLPELFICQFVPDPPSDELPVAEMEDYRNMVQARSQIHMLYENRESTTENYNFEYEMQVYLDVICQDSQHASEGDRAELNVVR